MINKPLIGGLIGFLLGGLVVSLAVTTFDKPPTPAPNNSEMTMSQMTDMLKTLKGDAYDKEFITQMIAHHQAAVDMAKLSASRANHQEIKDLSLGIITAQEKEINDMKTWQTQWGYTNSNTNTSHSMSM
ncbi:MAG: uncharacterized protein JWN75_252 [Candidatus Saccharibacteria bacterium]|nr:uncharacterized protein [Candidatus Saccharibacteria bacterium]